MKLIIDTHKSKVLESKANRLLAGKKNKKEKVKIKKARKHFFVKEIRDMYKDFNDKMRLASA